MMVTGFCKCIYKENIIIGFEYRFSFSNTILIMVCIRENKLRQQPLNLGNW